MNLISRLRAAFICAIAAFSAIIPSVASAVGGAINIAVIELEEDPEVVQVLETTFAALRRAVHPRQLLVTEMSSPEIEAAISAGRIDAYVSSSGFHWRMMPKGIRAVATLIESRRPNPNESLGAVFLVKDERKELQALGDLAGLRLSASYPTAFVGYRIGMAEIAKKHPDWEHFFRETLFIGKPDVPAVLRNLDNGKADAALIRACWLESNNIDISGRYRILNQQHDDLSCKHSTEAYPGWMLAVTRAADPADAALITKTLFNLRSSDGLPLWGQSTDLTAVDRLYRVMRLGPYAYLREWSLQRWVEHYWPWLAAGAMIVIALLIRGWRNEATLRRQAAALLEARSEAQRLHEKLEIFQKTGIVSQLSTMFAHELNQPLTSIRCFADGLEALSRNGGPSKEMLEKALSEIRTQTKRAFDIVQSVRSYAKRDINRNERVDIAAVIRRLGSTAESANPDIVFEFVIPERVNGFILANRLEIELLFWNLLKNAVAAAKSSPNPRIRIELSSEGHEIIATMENTGKVLMRDDLSRLTVPLQTTSQNGLGLGLSIISSIVECSRGTLDLEARAAQSGGGLRVVVRLPREDA